jgi:hypothetical protein
MVVGDCDNTSFNGTGELASRHKEYGFFTENDYAVTVTKGHEAVKTNKGSSAVGGNHRKPHAMTKTTMMISMATTMTVTLRKMTTGNDRLI